MVHLQNECRNVECWVSIGFQLSTFLKTMVHMYVGYIP